MNILIRRQKRKSLAFKLAYDRAEVLIPLTLTDDHSTVQNFIAQSLVSLSQPQPPSGQLENGDIETLVEQWSKRLKVTVQRVQIRPMTSKWGSISTKGNLTLSSDLCKLPTELVEYVVVHELLHIKFPNHHKGWTISMGMYLPAWRELERRLQQYAPSKFVD
jgi:hypothetical protein